MAVTLSGVLKDPYGQPLPGATIRFDAVRTSATVLNHIRAEAITDAQGDYSISVEVGRYDVRVMQGRSFLELAKNLEVRADSTATDLNELVVEWQGEQDLTPGIVIEFRALVDEARGYRDEAGASAGEAAASESSAADSATAASESASNAATSEQNAASSASAASASASSASDSADAASTSEANAASSASAAAASEASAATSASNAAGSASAAAASELNAAGSESAADDSALEAQHWAQYPNDTPVPEGDGSQFSAAHWAEISRQRAVNAMVAQGAWDASSGSLPAEPTGASYWLVTGAANGETIGGVEYRNKDMLLWTPNESGSGGTWSKIDNTDSVASVAGKTGAVTLVPGDVSADPAGTASSAVAAHEAKSSAHTPAQVGADPAGSAASAEQAAKNYAVQRANHTGTQSLSTISDAGTAAAANVGTGANDIPKTSQADARYARLSGPNDFDTMPSVAGSPLIESDSNSNGTWVRFADGTQFCSHIATGRDIDISNPAGALYRTPSQGTWNFPASFLEEPVGDVTATGAGSLFWSSVTTSNASGSGMDFYYVGYSSGVRESCVERFFAKGRWKA
ncbi:prophage tail fiber N-terminal domain-containing protein [Halomonas sp. OfavH-34-E]|uniref:prophage tail fiber N-terminal domain-containing protein n=1 Tax=Halomonas sp. OfavH-34-E TaxID=2954491 RepID=UPI0020969C24|nr:prophage tail fiber N-terminal domain-containing protein [Halomonas sp. OfavH-34-E]MCO7217603.1 prophage tail fiber N-terminal domain-containing protein [Halomonas sp. OfavH-34-E]